MAALNRYIHSCLSLGRTSGIISVSSAGKPVPQVQDTNLVKKLRVVSPNADTESADWTKQSWDLPPYKSREFLEVCPNLDEFRKLPVYKHAVAKGLIANDEWVGEPAASSQQDALLSLGPQVVGNAGLYYCCYKLSLLGWNVMPTARNARGVDIIAYNEDATEKRAIQVKALSKRSPVPLGLSLDKVMGDFWVILNRVSTAPAAFVLLPSEVRELAHRREKEGRISYWLQPLEYEQAQFREAWRRIGRG